MVPRKESLVRVVLRKAREIKDPLAELVPTLRQCNTNGQQIQVRSYHARDMPKELQTWCLDLCRENMAGMYNHVWGWSDTKKRRQLTSAASRFLIAHEASANRTPLGYINYRFEQDEGEAVLYCYELQVARGAQGRGLGHTLMELAEQIAWAAGMSKVMLTVFHQNTGAISFYVKRGYRLDETSPDYSPDHHLAAGGAGAGGSTGDAAGAAGAGDGGAGCGSIRKSTDTGGSSGGSGSGGGGGSAAGSSTRDSNAGGSDGGGGSGSQDTDAGQAAGYHIMSKRAPPQAPTQRPPPLPPPQQEQQQQPAASVP